MYRSDLTARIIHVDKFGVVKVKFSHPLTREKLNHVIGGNYTERALKANLTDLISI